MVRDKVDVSYKLMVYLKFLAEFVLVYWKFLRDALNRSETASEERAGDAPADMPPSLDLWRLREKLGPLFMRQIEHPGSLFDNFPHLLFFSIFNYSRVLEA